MRWATHQGVLVYICITRCIALCCWATRGSERPLWGFFSRACTPLPPTRRCRVSCIRPTPHSCIPSFTNAACGVGKALPMVDGMERARVRVRAAEAELERAKVELARLEVERAAVPAFHVSPRRRWGAGFTPSAAGGGGEPCAGVGEPGHECCIPCCVHHMERRTRRAVLSSGTTAVWSRTRPSGSRASPRCAFPPSYRDKPNQ
jgi:hypothetical protein